MACRAGCSQCCHAKFGVFEVEAQPIRVALAELEQTDPGKRQRIAKQARDQTLPHCALLVDNQCAVYAQRPLICRSQGLPLVVERAGKAQVDHCPLNFASEPPHRHSLMVLDNLNKPLAVLAQLDNSGGERVALADLAR